MLTPLAQLLTRITPTLVKSYAERGLRRLGTGVHYNDVPAVAYAIDPRPVQGAGVSRAHCDARCLNAGADSR